MRPPSVTVAPSRFAANLKFATDWMPACKRLISPYLLREATHEEDCCEATDLRVLIARDLRIGCRVRGREREYWRKFFFEITIRSALPTGVATEYDKLLAGWCDWLFYAHARTDTGEALCPWWLVDLHAWRYYVRTYEHLDMFNEIDNADGSSSFRKYDLRQLARLEKNGPAILIASSHRLTDEIPSF